MNLNSVAAIAAVGSAAMFAASPALPGRGVPAVCLVL